MLMLEPANKRLAGRCSRHTLVGTVGHASAVVLGGCWCRRTLLRCCWLRLWGVEPNDVAADIRGQGIYGPYIELLWHLTVAKDVLHHQLIRLNTQLVQGG